MYSFKVIACFILCPFLWCNWYLKFFFHISFSSKRTRWKDLEHHKFTWRRLRGDCWFGWNSTSVEVLRTGREEIFVQAVFEEGGIHSATHECTQIVLNWKMISFILELLWAFIICIGTLFFKFCFSAVPVEWHFFFYRFRVENFQEILGKILLEIFSVNLIFFIRNCLWVSFTHIYFRILYSVSDIKKIARNLFIVKKIYIYLKIWTKGHNF